MPNDFAQRLRQGRPLLGTFVKTPSPIVCEVLSQTELDVLCLDAEHAPFDRGSLDQCVFAARASGMPSLVRIQSSASDQILNALDIGASGIVVPHVTSAEMATQIARLSHFGAGGRGYAGSTRAAAYTKKSMPEHLRDSANETAVIAQIEDLEAMNELEAIAKVEGIDCLFVGRIDLTVAMGASSPADANVVELVERICAIGKANNKAVGMFVANLDELAHWRSQGASFFLLSSDHSFMHQGASALKRRFDESA